MTLSANPEEASALSWAAGQWGRPPEDVSASPLPGDASRRRYTRLVSGGETRILLEGPDPAENRAWLSIGRLLREGGFPLPEIHAWDLGRGLFLLEDLGDEHLSDLACSRGGEGGGDAGAPDEACLACYREAARVLARLHNRGWDLLASAWEEVAPRYDAEFVFLFEWTYFLEGARLLGFPGGFEDRLAPEGRKIAALSGCELERAFMHRDFQSRNILVRDGRPFLIDWQGGRLGPPYYDLASLVYDPYVDLPAPFQWEILNEYLDAREGLAGSAGAALRGEYEGKIRFFGMVRLMQAAGAYAHLAAARGKPAYARFLPRALDRALDLASELPRGVFSGVQGFLEDYRARLPRLLAGLGL
ncbi:MAG: phosphotransferase [Deltaproteobacteria bacterium]|jgi:aminoglycoside/choline kinase family phosphotransferase|nr:phosphotransferase [Deltaproteobacteria bacterium]